MVGHGGPAGGLAPWGADQKHRDLEGIPGLGHGGGPELGQHLGRQLPGRAGSRLDHEGPGRDVEGRLLSRIRDAPAI